jgi:hypothetical protein
MSYLVLFGLEKFLEKFAEMCPVFKCSKLLRFQNIIENLSKSNACSKFPHVYT